MDEKTDEKQLPGGRLKPTMMDVASRAGVSQATVSLVLNGSQGARLSDTTRERVRRAADELGYKLVRRGQQRAPADQTLIAFLADRNGLSASSVALPTDEAALRTIGFYQ